MKKVTIGLMPTRRFCFSREDALKYKGLVEDKLREWEIDFVNIDSVNEEGLLLTLEDAKKTVSLFQEKRWMPCLPRTLTLEPKRLWLM